MRSGLNEFVLRQSRTTKERKTSDSGVLRFPLKPFSLSWALVLLAPSPCPLTAPSSSPNDGQERGRAERLGRRGKYMPSSLSLSLSLSVLAIPPSVSQPARTGPLPPSAVPENVLNVTFKGICGDEDRRLLPSSSFPFLCPSPIPIKSDCHCTQNNGSLLLRRFATDSSGFPPAPNGGNIYLSGGNEKARFVLLISLT